MNTPIEHTTPEASPKIDQQRRRLAKGGLAAPVVIGTVLSRPVLGATPWTCTISGQLSGNMSGHETETCALGKSHSALTGEYATVPDKILAQFPLLVNDYIFKDLSTLALTLTSVPGTNVPATIHEVLSASLIGELLYAQRALVLLLNAKGLSDTSTYPLTEFQARLLFISAANPTHPQFVDTNPNVTWNYNPDVKSYIDVLYH